MIVDRVRRAAIGAASLWVCVLWIAPEVAAVITDVDEADDVCPPTADPCVVTERVEIVSDSLLDFGLRKLHVRGGLLDIGAGRVEILCGDFAVTNGEAVAITLGNSDPDGFFPYIDVTARRACSDDQSFPCAFDWHCASGTCSAGGGTIDISGRIEANGALAGGVRLFSTGDLVVRKALSGNSTHPEVDGGLLELESSNGSILIDGPLTALSGATGVGGDVWLTAEDDVTINAPINADGGDFDGGYIDVRADGDVFVNASMTADATAGSGFGGLVAIDARNVRIAAGTRMTAHGHAASGFGGDGGSIDLRTTGDLIVEPGAVFAARGARPDGWGGYFDARTGGDILMSGIVRLNGPQGGGLADLDADGRVVITEEAEIEAKSRGDVGGDIEIFGYTSIELHGDLSATSHRNSEGGEIFIDSLGDVEISGRVDVMGSYEFNGAGVFVEGCNVSIADGARLRNRAAAGEIELRGHELINVAAGASIRGRSDATVLISYRNGGPEPIIKGRIAPDPAIAPLLSSACSP